MPEPNPRLPSAIVTRAERFLAGPCAAPDGTPLVAAVSGGADSVALAAVLAELAPRWPLAAVAFVDHGLRDVTAERAAAERAAARVGVPFIARRLELPSGPGNLQARARGARYRALLEVTGTLGDAALLATGHTLSDQAETVLARILRGSGVPGLAGLAPRRGRIVRPLLRVSRAETRALGLDFADDPSNASPRFQRNRLRARVLEALGGEQPAIEAALASLADAARGATRILDALALAAPDTDLRGLDDDTAQALLLHVARARGARGPQRASLEAWARALTAGGLGAVSLGEGLRGTARAGRATVTIDDDPRRVVVAWRPGTYRGPTLEFEMTEVFTAPPEPAAPSTVAMGVSRLPRDVHYVRAADVAWPVRLVPVPRSERGVFGDEVDLASGADRGGWRLQDASGRTLVPPAADAKASGSREETRWIRIVLKPFERPRDTRVVGTGKGPLNKD